MVITMRIGVDVGGMSIKFGLVNEEYKIVARKVIDTCRDSQSAEEIITRMAESVLELLDENGLTQEDCDGLGIACPGTSDPATGVVVYSNNIEWENVPLLAMLKKYLHIPMGIANDADAAALGEVLDGAAKGKDSAVLLTLGTGVGGGVVIDRKIFAGPLRGGCELGHMVISRGGKLCTCGRKGCLEVYASATALMEEAREAAAKSPDSLMNKLSENNPEKINGKVIFDAQKQADQAAVEVVDNYEENLSIGIANLVNIFRPEIFILGGGVSAQKEYLTDALQEKVNDMCFGGALGEVPKIVTSNLGNDAGIIGAAYLQMKL